MKYLILVLMLVGCGSAKDHETAPVDPIEQEQQDDADNTEPMVPLDGSYRWVRMVRVDVELRPYYTFYDLGISGVIASPEFETHGWKLAYAIKEGSEPENCNDGEITGADYPPINVSRVKPNTHYFIIACPVHATRGEYGEPAMKEFTTGDLRDAD